ncbi:hypothetical protein THAOC_14819, partial [Thalassiosira oceanica]
YLGEGDVGSARGRAEACAGRLAELNEYVKVDVASGVTSLADEGALLGLVAGASVVVVTVPLPTALLTRLDEKCRSSGVCFIYSLSTGVFGQVFCDFGEAFTVTDKDGENPATSQVENILPSNPAVVKVLEDQGRHGLETGDSVTFSRVRGLDGLLRADEWYEVKVIGPYTLQTDRARRGCRGGGSGTMKQGQSTHTMQQSNARTRPCHHGRRRAEPQDDAHFQEARTCHRAAGRTAASWARCTRGMFGTPSDKSHDHTYRREVKRAVLHLGYRRHGADDIETGRRLNLIGLRGVQRAPRGGEEAEKEFLVSTGYEAESKSVRGQNEL